MKREDMKHENMKPIAVRSASGVLLLLIAYLAAPASAVQTSHWVHTSEADFKNGTLQNVVATNLGDLKLSRAVKTLLEQDAKVSAVYALAEAPDGTIYAATGPQGVVLKIVGEKVSEALKLDDGTSIFSLAIDADGGLLIGTGGEKGRILKLDKSGGKPKELFSGEGVQYIWCLVRTDDGNLYAGTGPEGQLFEVKPDGTHSLLLDTDENNLLSMIGDGKDLLYVGTDPNGLVYRVNRKTKDIYVVHDAAESEISALALDKNGNLYAATAEAMPQASETEPAGAAEQIGRPEGGAGGAPIPSPSRPEPKPPELPNPNPGEPDPIPKKLLILPSAAHFNLKSEISDLKLKTLTLPVLLAAAPSTHRGTTRKHGESDEAMPNPTTGPSAPSRVSPPPIPRPSGEAGQPREGGNAIYKIDKEGLVTEIFRQPVLVLSMIEQEGTLLVGTGSDGLIYQINPAAEETIVLAKVEPKQVMCLLPVSGGRIILGLANTGGIAAMTSGFATDGTYTSPVLDASQVSRFGKIQLHGSLPAGTTLKVSTRSGNVSEPDEKGWSKWTDPAAAAEFANVTSPAARFLQYRFHFTSAEGKRSAVVDDVDVAYQEPNRPPVVKSVKLTTRPSTDANTAAGNGASSVPQDSRYQTVTWEASDPNNDELTYALYFRSGSQAPWILLKDKLKETSYEWDTRLVADGRYEIRVVASDEHVNALGTGRTSSRVSDPIRVDNTPPVIGNLKARSGAGEVRIAFDAVDRSSTLASFAYTVDASDDWQTVLPSDKIPDGPEEAVDFAIPGLKPGQHQVTVRAVDARGNQATASIPATIDQPAKDISK